jgi:hypothetical protein
LAMVVMYMPPSSHKCSASGKNYFTCLQICQNRRNTAVFGEFRGKFGLGAGLDGNPPVRGRIARAAQCAAASRSHRRLAALLMRSHPSSRHLDRRYAREPIASTTPTVSPGEPGNWGKNADVRSPFSPAIPSGKWLGSVSTQVGRVLVHQALGIADFQRSTMAPVLRRFTTAPR